MTRGPDGGFTLLEVLVAMFVLGLLFVLLSQGMQFGLHTVQLQAATRDREGDIDAVDRVLRRLVGSADPGLYPEPATLQGTATAMSFTTELPLYGAEQVQPVDVVLSAEGGRLLLRWTPHRHVETFGPPLPPHTNVLLGGVDGLELSYWRQGGSGGWISQWEKEEKLPALVRIRLLFGRHGSRHWPPLIIAPLREPVEE